MTCAHTRFAVFACVCFADGYVVSPESDLFHTVSTASNTPYDGTRKHSSSSITSSVPVSPANLPPYTPVAHTASPLQHSHSLSNSASSNAASLAQQRRLQAYQQQSQAQQLHEAQRHRGFGQQQLQCGSDEEEQDDDGDESFVAPLSSPASSVASAAHAHSQSTSTQQSGPRKSGVGSKSKSSCHQCKSSKPDDQLYFCTNSAKEGVRKRRCRKKFCRSCLVNAQKC